MLRKVLYGILGSLVVSSAAVAWLYEKYKEQLVDQPPYFDLFIAETLIEPKPKETWRNYWGDAWNKVDKSNKRLVNWKFNIKDFETLDSIYLGIENTAQEKFYYVTWGSPNSRIRINFSVFRNGKIDSIPFEGFGCGTGIFIDPLEVGNTAGSFISNPLMYNPYTGYELPTDKEIFPELFKEIYGDSIGIVFEQATYSLPWNKTPSQMIKSDEFYIQTEKIIGNWKMGKFRLKKENRKDYKASYYFKKNGEIVLSHLYYE